MARKRGSNWPIFIFSRT